MAYGLSSRQQFKIWAVIRPENTEISVVQGHNSCDFMAFSNGHNRGVNKIYATINILLKYLRHSLNILVKQGFQLKATGWKPLQKSGYGRDAS